jgi:hypothetical protein
MNEREAWTLKIFNITTQLFVLVQIIAILAAALHFAFAQPNNSGFSGTSGFSGSGSNNSSSSSQTASTVICNPTDSNPPAACLQASQPNSAGLCPSGTHITPVGSCCPLGTMNVHNACATPASEDMHNAEVAKSLHSLFSIVPGIEGEFYGTVLDLLERAPGACEYFLGQSCTPSAPTSTNQTTPTPSGCGPGTDNSTCASQPTQGCGPGTDNSTCASQPTQGCGPGTDNSTCASQPTQGCDPGTDNSTCASQPTQGCGPGTDNSTCASQPTQGCGPGTDNSTCSNPTQTTPPQGCGYGYDNSTCGSSNSQTTPPQRTGSIKV